MAMIVGGGCPSAAPNVTPMIDILLVLIIILMVLPQLEQGQGEKAVIPLPAASSSQRADEDKVVIQVIGEGPDSSLLLNQQPVAWPDLEHRLVEVYAGPRRRVLFIKGDESLFFDPVAQAINVARRAVPDLR